MPRGLGLAHDRPAGNRPGSETYCHGADGSKLLDSDARVKPATGQPRGDHASHSPPSAGIVLAWRVGGVRAPARAGSPRSRERAGRRCAPGIEALGHGRQRTRKGLEFQKAMWCARGAHSRLEWSARGGARGRARKGRFDRRPGGPRRSVLRRRTARAMRPAFSIRPRRFAVAVFDFPRRISASSKVNVERPSATSSFASAKPRCGEEKYIICGLRELRAFIHNPVGVRETHVFSELSP